MAWWPAVLPSHREIVTARLVEIMRAHDSIPQAMSVTAYGEGPVGAATAHALATAMESRRPARRAATIETLTVLLARDDLPTAALGQAIAEHGGTAAPRRRPGGYCA